MTAADCVIVGGSLAGLRTAQELRTLGWPGSIMIIGDEPHPPYDRPPLSKGVLAGTVAPEPPVLAPLEALDVDWELGVGASGLDRSARQVLLRDGRRIGYGALVIATGRRARPWEPVDEGGLHGVVTIRTIDDALLLRSAFEARPRRVVIIGAGFIGSEVASTARELGLPVTVVARGRTPLDGALGESVGALALAIFRRHDVDFRAATQVRRMLGDDHGRVRGVLLDDGTTVDADVVVVATGSLPNVEWLAGTGLDCTGGVAVDAGLCALDSDGAPDPYVHAAGDVTRWAHPLGGDRLLAVEHWSTAIEQARYVARIIAAGPAAADSAPVDRFDDLPRFWSVMFGTSIKSVGVPSFGDQVVVAQGSVEDRRGVVLYGRDGRTVGAVALDAPRELVHFESLVAAGAPFPPRSVVADWAGADPPEPVPALFPSRGTTRPTVADGAVRGLLDSVPGRRPSREPDPSLTTSHS